VTREVYTDTEFIEFSRSQVFIRLFVDTDAQGDRLARKFGVRGYPTWIVLDRTGREIDRLVGVRSARGLKTDLEWIFEAAGPEEEVAEQAPVQLPSQTRKSPPPAAAGAPPAATERIARLEESPDAGKDEAETEVESQKPEVVKSQERAKAQSRPYDKGKSGKYKIESNITIGPPILIKMKADKPYSIGDRGVGSPIIIDRPVPSLIEQEGGAKVHGRIRIQCIFRKNGTVDSFEVWEGKEYGLAESAIDLIKSNWTFKPGTYNGKPVDVQATVNISFSIID
jgi:hypothetical protein